jgi:hypothetical protein
MLSGCLLRTEAGRRMDSSSGRTAHQWTKPLGTVENQIKQKKAKRRASIYSLETPNCSTTAAQTLVTSSASFLLRFPRALNNEMCPLLPPHHRQPPIATYVLKFQSVWRFKSRSFAQRMLKRKIFLFLLGICQPIYQIK